MMLCVGSIASLTHRFVGDRFVWGFNLLSAALISECRGARSEKTDGDLSRCPASPLGPQSARLLEDLSCLQLVCASFSLFLDHTDTLRNILFISVKS